MPAKQLVLGLDGADLALVRALGAGATPHLHALMARGAFAALESVLPFATLPNWTTFLTGLDPGEHGVFDFTVLEGRKVQFLGGAVREAPSLFRRLDRAGHTTAVLFFPGTHPPEPLERGIVISGWDSPVAFEADDSYIHPRTLAARIRSEFGPIRFDDVDEFDADRRGFHDELAPALVRRVDRKLALGRKLLAERSFDAFALYFGEIDTASHHLFAHHDARSPRHPGPSRASSGLTEIYAAVDAAVGALVSAAGPEAGVTIVSDHGSGPSSDKVLHVNRVLAHAGLLRFRSSTEGRALTSIKDLALTMLPPARREQVFRAFGGALPSWLESRERFAAIDFAHTRVFSEELSYFPSVRLVQEDDRVALEEARRALLAVRDPDTGARVVHAAHLREELYEGPFVSRAPALILELALDRGYSYNLARSRGPGAPVERLPRTEHVGRKGRSLPGGHRPRGLMVLAGPDVAAVGEVQARIADASATLLARLGHASPPHASGRVLFEVLSNARDARPLPDVALEPGRYADRDDAAVERRLRALGYVE